MPRQRAETNSAGRDWQAIAFWIVIVIGAVLRFAALGRVPGGLNSDEASSGVEALAVLRTGADLWGNRLPIWFPAWGSGMNMLYTYLTIPVIWLFGLDAVTLRAVSAAFGVLTLPVAYHTTRLYFGRDAGLIVMALLALLPWHVMASRWALDSNLAPLFFTLGLYTIGKALNDGGRWPILAFLPWAIAIYAYPVVLYPMVLATIGILFFFRRRVLPDAGQWATGIALAVLIALPFLLFFLKNYVLHAERLSVEGLLPFSVPTLTATRLSQIGEPFPVRVFNNLTFIAGGYRDDAIWHQSRFFLPLSGAAPVLTLAGAVRLGWHCFRNRRPHVILILVSCIVVPVLNLTLQLTRLNWFYIPSLMLVAYCLIGPPAGWRRGALVTGVLYLTLFLVPFYTYYFTSYNQEAAILDTKLGNGFRLGLEPVLRDAAARAQPDEPIWLDIGEPQPYLYPLFYGLAGVEQFQATRRMAVVDGVMKVYSFGRFTFGKDAMPKGRGFTFVSLSTALPCTAPVMLMSGPIWATGRCPAP